MAKFRSRRIDLAPAVVERVSRPSRVGEDHLARVRLARLLPVHRPEPPPSGAAPGSSVMEQAVMTAASRILAVTGPLPLADLVRALTRRFRVKASPWSAPPGRPPLSNERVTEIVADLLFRGRVARVDDNDMCTAIRQVRPPAKWQALHEAPVASDRHRHTTTEMLALFTAAGYESGGPNPRQVLTYHPLLVHHGFRQWSVLGMPVEPPFSDVPPAGHTRPTGRTSR